MILHELLYEVYSMNKKLMNLKDRVQTQVFLRVFCYCFTIYFSFFNTFLRLMTDQNLLRLVI